MTWGEARRWLFGLQLHGVKLGLDNIRALLAVLDHPERAYPSILITGTNGKGSVAAMCAAALAARGLKVGAYTSPHLVRFAERIAIDGRPLPSRRLASLAGEVRRAVAAVRRETARHPTFFEVATALGFLAFARAGVDVAVVEVGLGGRFDATNALDPIASALTSVALEHTRWLGNTVRRIAFEKSGIARRGRPFVIGPLPASARAEVERRARATGARLVPARDAVWTRLLAATPDGLRLAVRTRSGALARLDLPLPGRHQQANAEVAIATLLELPEPLRPTLDEIAAGLARTRWPGRLERVAGRPELLLDGAHNPHAARALTAYLAEHERRRRVVLVFASLADKDTAGVVRALFPSAGAVVATRVANPRALDPEAIRALAPRGVEAEVAATPARALARARRLAGRHGLVVVTGSLYLVGAVKALLSGQAPPDQG